MNKKNILLLFGGGGAEEEISKISKNHISNLFKEDNAYNIIEIYTDNKLTFFQNNQEVQLKDFNPYSCIPCFHGTPGETGEIQPLLEKLKINYIGCNEEASKNCFNKFQTKDTLAKVGIPTTPFLHLKSKDQILEAQDFFKIHKKVFIKANTQGSSVGCYPVIKIEDLEDRILKAFNYSDTVLVEKFLNARELEISTYELKGELQVSYPSEIIKGDEFYSYDEKYSKTSKTTTNIRAKDLSEQQVSDLQKYAQTAFKTMNLRHLSRIDFFLEDNQIYLNEINTFPGLTPISLFPKMLEGNGHSFYDFLVNSIENSIS